MLAFFRSIRFRLTLWFVAVFTLVTLLSCAFIYIGLDRALMQNVDDTLRRAAERALLQPIQPLAQDANVIEQLNLLSLAPTRLLNLDGAVLRADVLFPATLPVSPDEIAAVASGTAHYSTHDLNGLTHRVYVAPVRVNGERVAAVQVALRLDNELNTLAQVRTLLAILVPLSLLLASLGGWFLAGRALAPMERVRRDVETIMGDTDLSRRVSGELTQDEVGRLARTFDGLLERVQTAMGRERQFTADASHELRSPLTALKGEISVALSRRRSPEEYRDALAELQSSVDDMSRLVDDLLTLSRAGQNTALRSEPVNLVELAAHVCGKMLVVAEDARVVLIARDIPKVSVWVTGDKPKLHRAVTNLVHNAIRYTPAGGQVTVAVCAQGRMGSVEVRDTGIGIAPQHLPHIFERFYRTDASRARDSGGTGLGLPITQAIVAAHGGRLDVQSQVGKGSLFTITLPLHE